MVVDLHGEQVAGERIAQQRAPAGPHAGRGSPGELLFETIEAAKVPIDGGGELTCGVSTTLRRKIAPENAVQHVSRQIECKRLFDCRDRCEVTLVARSR